LGPTAVDDEILDKSPERDNNNDNEEAIVDAVDDAEVEEEGEPLVEQPDELVADWFVHACSAYI